MTKDALRDAARTRRAELTRAHGRTAPLAALERLAASPLGDALAEYGVFAGYVPIGSEFDPMPIMHHCLDLGLAGAVPVVRDRSAQSGAGPLEFQRWDPETELAPGPFDVPVPRPSTATVIPDLLFVPLLAADRQGWRIGYGAGYYDGALRALRQGRGTVLAVGLCFAGQLIDAVPRHGGDERLDWIVTETELIETTAHRD